MALFLATLVPVLANKNRDDAGSAGDVAAIRHTLPVVMASEVQNIGPLIIRWVATDGLYALASWRAAPFRGFATLAKRNKSWWWTGESVSDPEGYWTNITTPPQGLGRCFDSQSTPPSAKQLYDDGYIDRSVYAVARGRWKMVRPSALKLVDCYQRHGESSYGNYLLRFEPSREPEGIRYDFGDTASQDRVDLGDTDGHYDFDLSARGNYAHKTVTSGLIVGAKVTLWAPFVLDVTKRYTLDMRNARPPILGLRGTLRKNTLTFDLPAFTLPLGTILRGTISKKA